MFDIQTQLFEGRDIRFGPIDHEKDPEIESKWTHNSEFMRMMEVNPARPMSAAMIKKQYEKLEKQIDEDKNFYYFAIRAKDDDRLIGKAMIQWIEWTNGNGWIQLGIGPSGDCTALVVGNHDLFPNSLLPVLQRGSTTCT